MQMCICVVCKSLCILLDPMRFFSLDSCMRSFGDSYPGHYGFLGFWFLAIGLSWILFFPIHYFPLFLFLFLFLGTWSIGFFFSLYGFFELDRISDGFLSFCLSSMWVSILCQSGLWIFLFLDLFFMILLELELHLVNLISPVLGFCFWALILGIWNEGFRNLLAHLKIWKFSFSCLCSWFYIFCNGWTESLIELYLFIYLFPLAFAALILGLLK